MDNHSKLREEIRKIQNLDINQEDKNRRLFEIMNNSINSEIKEEDKILICNHYERECIIVAPCCQRYFPCRLCHDENSDHKINRFDIKEIICKKCNIRQNVSNKCINCDIIFGKYYCKICNLWLNDKNNPTFHCNDCGICRKGKKEDFFHCKKCNICLSIKLKEEHICVDNTGNSNCPCCHNYLFNSITDISVLKCGHIMHKECLSKYLKYNFNCPICKKGIVDLTEHWKQIDKYMETQQLPEEYKNKVSKIICNDCNIKSEVPYHFFYHKCIKCNGYNTSVL
tara:strand:- start:409 stop:1257 length:849 start_codon:yes stop_codon:yes gene_type:complete